MTRREVKSVTVEYEDGEIETFRCQENAYHVQRQNYSKGAKTPADGWQQHEIRWTDPESQHPPIEEEVSEDG